MNDPIKVMIVEDNGIIAQDLASKLSRNNIDVVAILDNGEDAVDSVDRVATDLILMDVQLAGVLDGISAAKLIKEKIDIPVIYLSDYVEKENVERAKKTTPDAYLQKPFHELDVVRAIEIACSNRRQKNTGNGVLKDCIFIKEGDSQVRVNLNDIIYFEADRAYSKIITESKTFMLADNMSHVFDQIKHKDFVKVHRSHIVNIKKITALEGNIVKLGKYAVDMSRGMREELIARLPFLR
jgi:DNA-binding LytR/AlgR family response regulator